jgi:hypothetical protein
MKLLRSIIQIQVLCLIFNINSFSSPTVFNDTISVDLGANRNNLCIDKMLYMGYKVESFKISFRLNNKNDFSLLSWPSQLVFNILRADGTIIQSFNSKNCSSNTVYTTSASIMGNVVRLRITTNGRFADLSEFGANIEIVNLTCEFNTKSKPNSLDFIQLYPGVEIIVFSPLSSAKTNCFYALLPAAKQTISLYLSPYKRQTYHKVNPKLGYNIQKSSNSKTLNMKSWLSPKGYDTGIYEELNGNYQSPRLMCLTVTTSKPSFFYLTIQTIKESFGTVDKPIVVEMDGGLDGDNAPLITGALDKAMVDAIRTCMKYTENIGEYIQDNATYNRRVKETLVIACASMLAATEGYLRFNNINFYHSIDPFRDADIIYDAACGRGLAYFWNITGPFQKINMHINYLNNPASGGVVLLHEWGHYKFKIFDEYIDDKNSSSHIVDPNSLMGDNYKTSEFCTGLNHQSNGDLGNIGPDPAWKNLQTGFGISPPRPPYSLEQYPQNQSSYLDVLHKLEELVHIKDFPNKNHKTPSSHPKCGAPGSKPAPCGGLCFDNKDCQSNRCDQGTGTQNTHKCIPNDGTGQLNDCCNNNNQCKPGTSCTTPGQGELGKCVANGSLNAGEMCNNNIQCGSGNCVNGKCVEKAELCQSCNGDSECKSGRCDCDKLGLTQNTHKCIPNDGTGQLNDCCDHNNQCRRGLKCNTPGPGIMGKCVQ